MGELTKKRDYGQGKTFFTLVEDYAKNPYNSFTEKQIPLGSRIFYKKTATATVGDLYITEKHNDTKVSVLYGRGAATTTPGGTPPEELAKFPEGSKTETTVGGIKAQTDIGNKSVYEVLDMMLLPEYLPYRTGGTVLVNISGAAIREVGEKTPTKNDVSVSDSKRKVVGKVDTYEAVAGAQTSTDAPTINSTCGAADYDTATTQEGNFSVTVSRSYADGTNVIFGAAAFDAEKNYAIGDYCYKMIDGNKNYYKFVKAHVAGEWNDDDAMVVDTATDENYKLNRIKTNKGNICDKYSTAANTATTATGNTVIAESDTNVNSWVNNNEFVKGYDASNTATVKYRYPYFATTDNENLKKQPLVDIDAVAASGDKPAKTVEVTLKGGYLQRFAVPQTWGEIGIQQFVSGEWKDSNAFTKSTSEQEIQEVTVSYNLYTIGTLQSGDVKVRITKK